jgi:hypothetical protein
MITHINKIKLMVKITYIREAEPLKISRYTYMEIEQSMKQKVSS